MKMEVTGIFFHVGTNLPYYRKGFAVAHLVEALRYKPEGGGFDSRWGNPDFSLT
jgi:hypothetical protein